MPLFYATAKLDFAPDAAHQANFNALTGDQQTDVRGAWTAQLNVAVPPADRDLWEERGFDTTDGETVAAQMREIVAGDVQGLGAGEAVYPVMYNDNGVIWRDCGDRCHEGYGGLVIATPTSVEQASFATDLHMDQNNNVPWRGVLRLHIRVKRLR